MRFASLYYLPFNYKSHPLLCGKIISQVLKKQPLWHQSKCYFVMRVMYLSQALAIKILPKWSQAKVIVEGSKHQNGRWETVCRCDQSWAPGSKSPNIETWQNSHQPGTVTLKHNLIFDACCKLLSFIQHKAPGCNFSLHRNISAWDLRRPFLWLTHYAAAVSR